MSNDAARHELAEVLALATEQMADLAAMQKKRAQLTATASVADGTVEVTVDAQGLLVSTIIDESYLDDHDFADLGDHVTSAVRAAAREIGRRSAELLVPLTERRKRFPALSDIVEGAPDFRDLMPDLTMTPTTDARPTDDGGDFDDATSYDPTVRR